LDDDTIPEDNYLENAYRQFIEHPRWGAFGGRNEGDFECSLRPWVRPLLPYLAVRDYGDKSQESSVDEWGPWEPVGAGMAVRREVVVEFINLGAVGKLNNSINRSGGILYGGEDSLLARCSYRLGLKCAYFPALRLKHVISDQRLSFSYLRRLLHCQGYSLFFTDQILASRSRNVTLRDLKVVLFDRVKGAGLAGLVHWFFGYGYYCAIKSKKRIK
jgi:hypothetical protein